MFSSILFLCVSVFAVASVHGQTTEVSQCISNGGELPINTEVVGCDSPPCQLPQLQDVTLNIVFKAPKTMRTIRTVVTAYMSLGFIVMPIPYDLQEASHTCNFLMNTYCPVMQHEVVQYQLKMFIESFFPVGTSVTLEFRLNDEATGSPFVCIRVPIRITAPVTNNGLLMKISNGTLTK